ncbi:SDR family oxidoreductase [Actinoplanes sp. NPDC048967]|uniref:SDR family oxidoreductase n=1 Tax=Actinoplanes sp. NPDC048967 TaxID=3155269 RepID=UPI0033DD32CF
MLITGASSGIGRATAELALRRGWTVFGTSRAPERMSEAARLPGVTYVPLDQGDPDGVRRCAERVGPVDVLVNNAGQSLGGPLEDVPDEAVRRLFEVDVLGPVQLTKALLPGMRARGGGRIIFIGSLMADFPVPFQGGYAAAKGALRGFVTALRTEVAPFGITAALVQPGYYRSEINDRREWHTVPGSPYAQRMHQVRAAVTAAHQHAGDPREVAEAVLRLTTTARPPLVTAVGSGGPALRLARRFVPDRVLERLVARRYGITGSDRPQTFVPTPDISEGVQP